MTIAACGSCEFEMNAKTPRAPRKSAKKDRNAGGQTQFLGSLPLSVSALLPWRPWHLGVHLSAICLLLLFLAGCGSKISEANYYRVQHGMSEDAVELLLGPAHEETSEGRATTATTASTTSSQPAPRKVKVWKREALTIRVTFEDGKVVSRSAEGIASEEMAPVTRRAAQSSGTDER